MCASRGGFAHAWFHAHLILGGRVLALRRWGGGGGEERDPLIAPGEEELRPGGTPPPAWKAKGCKEKRGDRCAWWLCMHEGYKTKLVHDKYQSDIKVLENAGEKIRGMSEEQTRRHLENKFLERIPTGSDMHRAVKATFKGEAKGCTWANGAMIQFEEWLENLLPARHACVKNVFGLHRPAEQICSEVITDEFKMALYKSCQEDLQPSAQDEERPVETEGRWARLKKYARNPYKRSDVVMKTFTAYGTVSTVTLTVLGAMAAITGGAVALVAALITLAMTAPALVHESPPLFVERWLNGVGRSGGRLSMLGSPRTLVPADWRQFADTCPGVVCRKESTKELKC